MPAPDRVAQLVETFRRNLPAYRSGRYNEAQVRREFIAPLFKTLGWDVDNTRGYAEAYKDVVHEDAIRVGGATKAPDYCFRIGGTRKFFLEAKKPSTDIRGDTHPAYQLRRYAWSAKLPLSILTDFEELAVYDCRLKPAKGDKSATARVQYYTFDQYPHRWDELAAVFARDAVLKGSFDRYADSTRRKRGTAEVDDAFLAEIESWRDTLARNFALRNPDLSQRELNFAVQQTIDRIIFLRICEDRGIEDYGKLQALRNGDRVYPRLFTLFQHADDRYNSGLFHFQPEPDRPEQPDRLTPALDLDDKPLKDILRRLYYPDSPYEFSVLPADILGQVYEQFLGRIIRLTPGHRARVEEKPEVRKAGGVYYTPTYIVDYIVEQTVGRLLEGKPPRAVSRIRILDPACGSGSFLLGAYQKLLDWHRDYYLENQTQTHAKAKRIYQAPGGEWRLTTAERKRILLNNIYGVDIDPQAVEVTKLSLLLKVLEGESGEALETQLRLFHERALPDLGQNIKCGNSLVGPDFYHGERQGQLFDEDEVLRINAFDWHAEFPRIFRGRNPGFHAVIGNPPYIRIQTLAERTPAQAEYLKNNYEAAAKGNYDIYVVFVERGLELLNRKGHLGFILPHKFFNAKYGAGLRALLSARKCLRHVVHFGHQQVFEGATTYTCLLFLAASGSDSVDFAKVDDLVAWRTAGQADRGSVAPSMFSEEEWIPVVGDGAPLFARLAKLPVTLKDVALRIFQGLKTGADAVYIVKERERQEERVKVFSNHTQEEHWLEPGLLHPLIKGGDSKRYRLSRTKRLILFPYETRGDGTPALITATDFANQYPLGWQYLSANKAKLEARERGKMRGSGWYAYSRNQALDVIGLRKLFTPDLAAEPSFAFDESGEAFFTGGVAGGYGILLPADIDPHALLAVLNSALLGWYLRQRSTVMRGGYLSFEARFIRDLPLAGFGRADASQGVAVQQLSELGSRMIELCERLGSINLAHERTVIERQIAATDSEIDRLVYELYGLTEEEIGVVEEGAEE